MGDTGGMLEHVRVLQLGAVGPGARAARVLADYGADVVRVEPPPRRRSAGGHDVPFHTYSGGRGTRRLRIDLGQRDGVEALLRVAAGVDVVLASFRPTTTARLGIDYDSVCAVNPSVIYCAISGYGEHGPYADWAGHDINYLAVSGLAAHGQRRADGGPPVPGATIADGAGGGMQAVIAVLAALARRDHTGEGRRVDVSALDGLLWLMAVGFEEYLATGDEPAPGDGLLTGRYAWYDFYRTGDDRWLAVGAIEPRFYENLCVALGLPHLVERQYDPDQDALRTEMAAAFATRTRDEWIAELGPADTCVAPVNGLAEALDDPQVAASLHVLDAHHGDHGPFRQLGPILGGAQIPPELVVLPSASTCDTEAILRQAGVAASALDQLRSSGVIE